MYYVGIDVHWNTSSVYVLDENGKRVQNFTVRGSWQRLMEALKEIPGPYAVCYEASNGYGYLYEQLAETAVRVQVAHPGQLRLIFRDKRKNDRVDAYKLALLLFMDQVPQVYVPKADTRQWRRLITFRQCLVDDLVRTKNRLRNVLRRHGVPPPRSLWSKSGLAWLEELTLPEEPALERDLLLDDFHRLRQRIKRVEAQLKRIAQGHPGVALLMTIPGIGLRTAEAVMAWIDDATRFDRNKRVGSYFGLVPSQDASAGVNRLGHITKRGPALVRKLLVEAAWQARRRCPEFAARFERLQRDDPRRRKIAIVALAHHLLQVMLAVLKRGSGWESRAAA